MYTPLPLSPRKARHFPPISGGKRTTKEKENYIFYYFITHFWLTYAGFFASSDNLFFLLSSFRFCGSLKNDGRDELRFLMALMLDRHSWTVVKVVGNTIIKKYEIEWRIYAKNTGIKYAFSDYPMPDSSLRVRLCFFFYHHFGSAHRSRMTAEVNCVL